MPQQCQFRRNPPSGHRAGDARRAPAAGYSEDVYCCRVRSGITGHEYEASAEITIRKGKTPPDNPAAHDAREVADTLGPRTKRGSGFSVY